MASRGLICRIVASTILVSFLPSLAFAGTLIVSVNNNQTSAHAGTNITTNFSVTNIITPSTGVVLNVPLPAKTTFVTSDSGCTLAASVISCNLANFTPLQTKDVNITLRISDTYVAMPPENGTGYLTVSGDVTATTGTSAGADSDTSDVTELADLNVTQYASNLNINAGESFHYSIVVDNLGPSAARQAAFEISFLSELFEQVTIQSCAFSVSQAGGAITQFSCVTGPQVGTQFVTIVMNTATNFIRPYHSTQEDIDGDGDPDGYFPGRVRLSLIVRANEPIELNSAARAVSETPDPNLLNNEAAALVQVDAVADLSIEKTAVGEIQNAGTEVLPYDILSAAPFPEVPDFSTSNIIATAGRRIRYTIEVENVGPSDANNVLITDSLPAGVTVIPGTITLTPAEPFSCQFGTPGNPADRMTCGIGTLLGPDPQNGAPPTFTRATLQYDVKVDHAIDPGTLLLNNTIVSSSVPDIDNSNNFSTAFTVISPITGVSGCSVGGTFDSVQCGSGSASLNLNGFGFALPEAGALVYSWTSDCPGGVFSNTAAEDPQFTFTTANPDNSPVSCQVQLGVENGLASSVCTGNITVTNCSVDCNGVLGGSGELDRCGVCNGSGDSCLGCQEVNTRPNLAELDETYREIRSYTRSAAALLRTVIGGSEGDRAASKIRRNATKLLKANIAYLQNVPASVTTCTNTQFCVSASNVSVLSSAAANTESAVDLLNDTLNKLKKASDEEDIIARASRLRKKGNVASVEAQKTLSTIPSSSSSCS